MSKIQKKQGSTFNDDINAVVRSSAELSVAAIRSGAAHDKKISKATIKNKTNEHIQIIRNSYSERDVGLRQRLKVLARITAETPPKSEDIPTGWFSLLLANCIIFAEGILLHPVMDIVGVYDQQHQLIVSVVIVYACAGAAKICFALAKDVEALFTGIGSTTNSGQVALVLKVTIGAVFFAGTLFLLGFLGKLRSVYVLLAIAEHPELMKHSTILQAGIIIVTALLPVIATIMWNWGIRIVTQQSNAVEYDRALSEVEAVREELQHLHERLDAEIEAAKETCNNVLEAL